MESRAKALGHPIHQMLIPFPFGLLSTAVIFDIVYLFVSDATTKNTLSVVSFWMIAAGIIGGLLAAPFGLIDYLASPSGTRAKSVGLLHAVGNLFVLILFAVSLWLRYSAPAIVLTHEPTMVALVLSFAAFVLRGGAVRTKDGGWRNPDGEEKAGPPLINPQSECRNPQSR